MGSRTDGDGGVSRRKFIKTSAAAAGGAAVVVGPAAVLSGEQKGVVTKPSSPAPPEPVMAYVRDAKRGEVTVMAGTGETTYRDPALVKRLLAAAPQTSIEGGADVVAP
jgi:anaerobic selenocysteine-containing dehydrogenase